MFVHYPDISDQLNIVDYYQSACGKVQDKYTNVPNPPVFQMLNSKIGEFTQLRMEETRSIVDLTIMSNRKVENPPRSNDNSLFQGWCQSRAAQAARTTSQTTCGRSIISRCPQSSMNRACRGRRRALRMSPARDDKMRFCRPHSVYNGGKSASGTKSSNSASSGRARKSPVRAVMV